MEFWLYLPQLRLRPDELVQAARTAEDGGFTGIAFMDHLAAPGAPDEPTYEAMTVATWVAAHTSTLKVGHLVLCDAFRHPAVLAKAAVTLDHASGGRFELGIGYGSVPDELTEYGITDAPARERAATLVESVTTIRELWTDGRLQPPPLSRIPLLVGGVGPTALRLAREHADWWNVPVTDLDRLDELRPQVGTARVSVQVMVALDRPGKQPAEPLARARKWFPTFADGILGGTPEQVRDGLDALAARGVDRVYLWPAPPVTLAGISTVCGLG